MSSVELTSASTLPRSKLPPAACITPLKLLLAARVNAPGPLYVRSPVPVSVPLKVAPRSVLKFTPVKSNELFPVLVNVWMV